MKEDNDLYLIEGIASKDLIGYKSYIKSLKSAIGSGAKFIGLISDFGVGKSTLINMLETEYKDNNEFIKINLWNCNDKDADDVVPIHTIFLHQLIDSLNIDNKKYYKKKIDRKYNFFDIKFYRNKKIYIYFLIVFMIMALFENLNIFNVFPDGFYSLLISVLFALCLIIHKPLISYKKPDDTYNKIDENDTKDLYKEILEEYFKNNRDKKLIISLEELDRYENPSIIIKYLKEFYKFYSETENVVFIVSIKPAPSLSDENQKTKDVKEIYEKVFDFILNLRPINIQDYDFIVTELLKSKENIIPKEIIMPNKNGIKKWNYLYRGNNIRIRDIKHRYNFTMSLYDSIKENSNKPDINKCLYISYLEDECPDLYQDMLNNDKLLNDIIVNYALNKNICENEITNKLDPEEKKILLEGLQLKYISVDYKLYFYKYPSDKVTLSPYEYSLYRAVLYDEEVDNLYLIVNCMEKNNIINILEKRPREDVLPDIVFEHKILFSISIEKYKKQLKNSIKFKYDLCKNTDNSLELLGKSLVLSKSDFEIFIEQYKEVIIKNLFDLSEDERVFYRKKLCSILKNNMIYLKELYFNNNKFITLEEIQKINNIEILKDLIDYSKLENFIFKELAIKINQQTVPRKTIIINFIKEIFENENTLKVDLETFFYNLNFATINFNEKQIHRIFNICKNKFQLANADNFYKFIKHIGFYSEYLDKFIINQIKDKGKEEFDKYVKILHLKDIVYDASVGFLNEKSSLYGKYSFSKGIREKFYLNGYYDYYIISTRLDTKVYDIEYDKFENLNKLYITLFESRKEWNTIVSEPMKSYLYENVNFNKLSAKQLNIFNDMIQTFDMVNSVINTNDSEFINGYLKKIIKLKRADERKIFELISEYKRSNFISKSTLRNLKNLTINKKNLELLDGRKYKNKVSI